MARSTVPHWDSPAQVTETPLQYCAKKRLKLARPSQIIIEDFVYYSADIFKDIPPFYKELVKGGRACYIKIVALAGIPFGIYAVQGEGNLAVNIGSYGRVRPGRIYFA